MRDTACFSMYSDMSTRTMALSSSNMNSASALASSVLPTPVGPEEDEAADGPVGIAQARAVAADGVGNQRHRFVLTDDALVQPLFHMDELLHFAFEHARDRDAGPLGDDLGDVFFVDLFFEKRRAGFDGFEIVVGRLRCCARSRPACRI